MADSIAKIYVVDRQLTHAQIILLGTVSITIVEAQGADLVIVPMFSYILVDARGGAYSGDTGMSLKIGSAVVGDFHELYTMGAVRKAYYGDISDEAPDKELTANTALLLSKNSAAQYGGGHVNNTMSIRMWYTITEYNPFAYVRVQ